MAAQVLTRVLARQPADAALQEVLRARRAGSRDRRAIGELLYAAIRKYFALRWSVGEAATAIELCAAAALAEGIEPPPLAAVDVTSLRRVLDDRPLSRAPEAARHGLSETDWSRLQAQYGSAAAALAQALDRTAPVDLRVNVLKATVAQAQEALARDGIAAEAVAGVPGALRLERRAALGAAVAFRDGWVEPQDAGSQRLAQYLRAQPGERVADWCAGAGGKTLALGAAMQDRGELWALDVDASRLARLAPRLLRSGLSCVRTRVLRGAPPAETFDAVLVDAPCSASGTWRRRPDLRLHAADLAALAALQGRILREASACVAPGGRLVYATCSLWREENEAVVETFLAGGGWRADEAMTLRPDRDGTDGFFAVRLHRC
ncbi:MAG TPA: RsmB/NOP family class I SAM-dependent RNA methyltransferase [Candidatus Binatia bacterium]|nr:RsmB/NOP family class I SAM-dependent RNA methyltransferase [Candidatus Binatia bacterium]